MAMSIVKKTVDHLHAVDEEDKVLVESVIHVLQALRYVHDWEVRVFEKRYEVIGWLSNKDEVMVDVGDTDLIRKVNEARVESCVLKWMPKLSKLCFRVVIIPRKEPVMLSERVLEIREKKRKTWFSF